MISMKSKLNRMYPLSCIQVSNKYPGIGFMTLFRGEALLFDQRDRISGWSPHDYLSQFSLTPAQTPAKTLIIKVKLLIARIGTPLSP